MIANRTIAQTPHPAHCPVARIAIGLRAAACLATQTIPERDSQTIAMVRTDDPACAHRVIVPTT